jgi:hypothetical protein
MRMGLTFSCRHSPLELKHNKMILCVVSHPITLMRALSNHIHALTSSVSIQQLKISILWMLAFKNPVDFGKLDCRMWFSLTLELTYNKMMPFVVSPSLNSGEPCRTTFTPFDKLMTGFDKLSANGFVIILLTVSYTTPSILSQ